MVYFEQKTLGEWLRSQTGYIVEIPAFTLLQDNIFEDLKGTKASAIAIYESSLVLRS